VSAKLTPEICINKASRNNRLTAASRWATASDSHSQTCLQTLFFFSSLSSFDETTTELHPHAEKLTETVLHLNLGHFVGFWFSYFFCFLGVFLVFFPFDEKNNRTTSVTPSPGLEAEGLTPKLLRLKLYCIWTWRFFNLILLYFIFQSSLCLSNACLAYYWLVYYLPIYIFETFLFICLFCFLTCLFICFSLFL
jgi:hypothetical protein